MAEKPVKMPSSAEALRPAASGSFPKDLQGFFNNFTEKLMVGDPEAVGLVVAVLLGLITIIVFLKWTKKKIFGRVILMCGPCDSGKTTVWSQLIKGKPVQTYTSMKENVEELPVKGGTKSVTFVDCPGHERLRDAVIDKYMGSLLGLVYVVDSSTLSKQIRDVAEFLFNLLTNNNINKIKPNVVILCNKQDVGLAKGQNLIQSMLEKELNACRVSHSVRLEGTSNDGSGEISLGVDGKDFTFSDLKFPVKFIESSAQNLDSLEPLKAWIDSVA